MSFLRFLPWGTDTECESDNVTVQVRHISVLILLSELNGEIEGRHKLQKLVFMTDSNLGDGIDLYSYRKYDYGPYSKRLERDLSGLERKDLIRINKRDTLGGNSRYTYKLLPDGENALREAPDNDTVTSIRDAATNVAALYGDLPISNFLQRVKDCHPYYWENNIYRTRL